MHTHFSVHIINTKNIEPGIEFTIPIRVLYDQQYI